ncbi:glycerophosphodiester phosphodiesterase family protein [Spirochaeta lutea]|uniref:GP-PDE domain-containing protein n=1 Tax=Spirochaeta lutea TaxID=1480694 RepID=A0A098QX73_9SPIO|nr:glycerophosphodiester phosphodiesterase family protein [Spirochaeta lutea]KGE71087.1 hypothetical protein DC28_13070 [Spirochaeta lutea]
MRVLIRTWYILSSVFLVITITNLLPNWPQGGQPSPLLKEPGIPPAVVPHGGAKLLYPENTVFSFWAMNDAGYEVFEIDLALTRDGQLISHHDLDIQGTTGISGRRVDSFTYDELLGFNFGSQFQSLNGDFPYRDLNAQGTKRERAILQTLVPARLEDLFVAFPDKQFLLELKDTVPGSGDSQAKAAAAELVRLIARYGMSDKVTISSFDDQVISYLTQFSRGILPLRVAASTQDSVIFAIITSLRLGFFLWPSYDAFMLPADSVLEGSLRTTLEKLPAFIRDSIARYDETRDVWYSDLGRGSIIRTAHKLGKAVYYWTVNSPQIAGKLTQLHADGIITDRPDIISSVVSETQRQQNNTRD